MPTPAHIWYACYGSNLRLARFMCYICGGTPEGGKGVYPGSLDSTAPTHNWSYLSGWRLHFARTSEAWGNQGVAFLHPSADGAGPPHSPQDAVERGTLCRLYKITFDQFIDVLIQENGGDPRHANGQRDMVHSTVEKNLVGLQPNKWFDLPGDLLASGWYRRVACLQQCNDLPVLTFTDTQELPFSKPSLPYLRTITLGLYETFHELTNTDIGRYLSRNVGWTPQETLDVADQALETFTEESRKRVSQVRRTAKRHGDLKESDLDATPPLRVMPTSDRSDNRGEFILQIHPDQLKNKLFKRGGPLRKREVVAVAAWHGGQEYRVLASVLPAPTKPVSSTGRVLQTHEIALDQKLRIAIGARLGDWVVIYRLHNRRRTSFVYWLFERLIGTQPQLMRTHKATFEDMEIDVARIPETTFHLIGAEPGSTVAISSTLGRAHVRAAVLAGKALEDRRKQMQEEPDIYMDPRRALELHRVRSGSAQSDLPPIFIDDDLRQRLKIKPGDAVRVVRDSVDVFFTRIYVIAFPILLGLVTAVLSYEHHGWKETAVRVASFVVIVLATLGVVIWEVRSKFRRR